jgi:hypothetical protein
MPLTPHLDAVGNGRRRLDVRQLILILLVGCAFAVATAPAASASNAPLRVNFVKHVVDPTNLVFEGTVSGAVDGSLVSRLVTLNSINGPIYNITFDWIVSAGDESFTARTTGAWNTDTGQVVMNGTIIAGYLNGAQVHEQGHLVDPTTLTFEGFLQLMPATAG